MWTSTGLLSAFLLLLPSAVTAQNVQSQFEASKKSSNPCPVACSTDIGPAGWTHYHDTERLSVCREPILLDYNLYTGFGQNKSALTIRACTLGDADTKVNYLLETENLGTEVKSKNEAVARSPNRRSDDKSTCGTSTSSSATAKLSWWDGSESVTSDQKADIALAIENLKNNLPQDENKCKERIIFSYVRGALVGMYAGVQLDDQKTASSLLQKFIDEWKGESGSASRKTLEVCDKDRTSPNIFGVVADIAGDFEAVQSFVRSWTDGNCAPDVDGGKTKDLKDSTISSLSAPSTFKHRALRNLNPRDECRTITVAGGDLCGTLATRCGISLSDFLSYNPGSTFCNTLAPGQRVCCSAGTLPPKPVPQPDGTCATHDVSAGQYCSLIAATYGITVDDLYTFNKQTWAWNGCALGVGQRICVSEGNPPMPAAVEGTICGPTVPGTSKPSNGESLASLNPCPLNACCNAWGYCGTTAPYCTLPNTETGNPGTTNPDGTGCISNCGMKLVGNDNPPAQYRKIGYFQGYNKERPCGTMDIEDFDDSYTHIHFGFATISSDLQVVIPDSSAEQWAKFHNSTKIKAKKILAFGGYKFSNDPATSGLFRLATLPTNRNAFADRVVAFANQYNLDGLDFDWEYPGASDIPGSEPGQEADGLNYVRFLATVRTKLATGKSISVAAPASYHYLREFRVPAMASVLDYMVYMAYDLHGQWDVGNPDAMDGCPAGNCLRSHVNSTETYNALVMVTKAGMPSDKVVVGVSSYGRSFKMSDWGCRFQSCTFLGDRNTPLAKPGNCTNEAGILSDYEIAQVTRNPLGVKAWYDADSDSDLVAFDGGEWVSHMSKETKARRIEYYQGLNFGGTSDWSVDLQDFST
ncbi:unnamed protein product [Clonostachys rosea]|uniref:chitinase n=1 Tax=Bionectria ochroleuca TaxID=29856 RepID=A0ABY6UBP6_BIOOC|nr:unnamed protein product [Clonostachys rosea]